MLGCRRSRVGSAGKISNGMSKKPRVIGLDDFRLSLTGLTRLGDRPVRLSVQLVGRSVSALRHLRPRQRGALLSVPSAIVPETFNVLLNPAQQDAIASCSPKTR